MQNTFARTGLGVAGIGLGAVLLVGCAQAAASPAAPSTPYHRPPPHLVKRVEPVAPYHRPPSKQVIRDASASGDPAPPFVAARP